MTPRPALDLEAPGRGGAWPGLDWATVGLVVAVVLLLVPPVAAQGRLAIVAKAEGVDVSRGELEDEIVEARTSGDLGRTNLTLTVDGLETFVTGMVERKLLAARARATGLDRDPEVARRLEREITRMLAEALVGYTRARVDVSPAAIEAFYQANGDRFRPAPRRKTRHIVVATEAEALAIKAKVHDLDAFDRAARRANTDGSGSRGGDLGWVAPATMVDAFDALVFSAAPRTVAGPARTALGWHLVFVEEVDTSPVPPLALVRDRVVESMKADAVARLVADVRSTHVVSVERGVLAELLK